MQSLDIGGNFHNFINKEVTGKFQCFAFTSLIICPIKSSFSPPVPEIAQNVHPRRLDTMSPAFEKENLGRLKLRFDIEND